MKRLILAMVAAGLMSVVTPGATAGTQAYSTSFTTGNQAWTGNLGVDFNVNAPITVTSLGAYDSGGLGFNEGITVGLYQRLPGGDPNTDYNGTLLASVTIIGTEGSVSGNYRFVGLSSPLTLPAGYYDVDAVGFNGVNLILNANLGGVIQSNNGGGLLSFVGSGRYDLNQSLDYPTYTTVDQGESAPTLAWGGGSFIFSASVPEPSSIILFSVGMLGVLLGRRSGSR